LDLDELEISKNYLKSALTLLQPP